MNNNYVYGDIISKIRDSFRYVATIGAVNDFAVYKHYAYIPIDAVARTGNKVGVKQARELFPELDSFGYRV